MKCAVCKHPLVRVSSRTVMLGQGRKRRVPIYARCPRLTDPVHHPAVAIKRHTQVIDGYVCCGFCSYFEDDGSLQHQCEACKREQP